MLLTMLLTRMSNTDKQPEVQITLAVETRVDAHDVCNTSMPS